MAAQDQLILKFSTASGDKTWKFRYADPSVTTQKVKNLMDTMIANGSIYRTPPLAKQSAQLMRVQVSDFIIND